MNNRKFSDAVKEILKPCDRKVPRSALVGAKSDGFDELDYELLTQAADLDRAFESAISAAKSLRHDLEEAAVRLSSGYLPSYDVIGCSSSSNDYSRALAVAESLRKSLFSMVNLVVADDAGKRLTKLISAACEAERVSATSAA